LNDALQKLECSVIACLRSFKRKNRQRNREKWSKKERRENKKNKKTQGSVPVPVYLLAFVLGFN
jgi:hypothetical protein